MKHCETKKPHVGLKSFGVGPIRFVTKWLSRRRPKPGFSCVEFSFCLYMFSFLEIFVQFCVVTWLQLDLILTGFCRSQGKFYIMCLTRC